MFLLGLVAGLFYKQEPGEGIFWAALRALAKAWWLWLAVVLGVVALAAIIDVDDTHPVDRAYTKCKQERGLAYEDYCFDKYLRVP